MTNPIHTRLAGVAVALAIAAAACSSTESFATDNPVSNSTTSTTTSTTTISVSPESTVPLAVPIAQQGDAELAALLGEIIADTDVPAIGVSVFDGEQIVESAVTGARRRGNPTPVELTDLFHIGSNAKAMTATLVATYVDEGMITWDTSVGDVYGGGFEGLDANLSQVTFEELLSQTSGLDDEIAIPALEELDQEQKLVEQRMNVVEVVLAQTGHGAPGQYGYSNVGYTIVGAMLEQLTGKPWEELVQTRLFDELGMDSCGFYAPGTAGEVDQPWGHFTEVGGAAIDPGHPDADYPHAIAPAGLVHCSMADWALFLQSQLRGFQGSDTEIVSPEAFVALQAAPPGSDYALGWATIPTDTGNVLWHHGSNERFTSAVWLVPGEDSGILVVTNIGEATADPIIDAVIGAVSERMVARDQVDIGGRKMFLHCRGTGSPTVVLEHGLGTTGADWSQVQNSVSNNTRVCFTSRAGMGLSDPTPGGGIRTAQDAADDLSAVLAAADVPGPYVLVGHSFGGLVVRLFADQNRDDVAGVVLVDTTHEDLVMRLRGELSPEAWNEVSTFWIEAANAERMDLEASGTEVAEIDDLGDIPLVVLQAGEYPEEEAPPGISQATIDEVDAVIRSLDSELQLDLATLSTNGTHVLVDGSGHFIQLDRPETVIEAINSVLAKTKR